MGAFVRSARVFTLPIVREREALLRWAANTLDDRTYRSGAQMEGDFSAYSAETLLAMIREEEGSPRDLSYEAGETLLKRWRQGIDLKVLIELLQSKITSDRCTVIGGPV